MNEKLIREEIWKIVKDELENPDEILYCEEHALPSKLAERVVSKIKNRVNKLLNDNKAILVYQP